MMDRDAILRTLRDAEPALRAQGVAHAAVFGSVARGEAGPDSDIDIMIEIAPDRDERMDLFTYHGLISTITDMFTQPVDVADRKQLKPHVRPSAERDAVYAF